MEEGCEKDGWDRVRAETRKAEERKEGVVRVMPSKDHRTRRRKIKMSGEGMQVG